MRLMDPSNAVGMSENSKDGVMPAFCSAIHREGLDFLSRTVTADETWIRLYDRQTVH